MQKRMVLMHAFIQKCWAVSGVALGICSFSHECFFCALAQMFWMKAVCDFMMSLSLCDLLMSGASSRKPDSRKADAALDASRTHSDSNRHSRHSNFAFSHATRSVYLCYGLVEATTTSIVNNFECSRLKIVLNVQGCSQRRGTSIYENLAISQPC